MSRELHAASHHLAGKQVFERCWPDRGKPCPLQGISRTLVAARVDGDGGQPSMSLSIGSQGGDKPAPFGDNWEQALVFFMEFPGLTVLVRRPPRSRLRGLALRSRFRLG